MASFRHSNSCLASSPLVEKRRAPRYKFRCKARLFDPLHSSRIAAQTADLSFTDCRVIGVEEPIEIDTIIWLEIQKGGETLNLWARVVHSTGENALGLAFLRAREEENSTLIRWISEITSSTIASC